MLLQSCMWRSKRQDFVECIFGFLQVPHGRLAIDAHTSSLCTSLHRYLGSISHVRACSRKNECTGECGCLLVLEHTFLP